MPIIYESTTQKETKSTSLSYILTLPEGISEGERLPLIVFLHGAGERGTDIERLRVYCIPKLFTSDGEYKTFKAITLSPQCPANTTWIDYKREIVDLIDEICAKYSVDTGKISLCGISMGGFGTWEIAMTYPHKFHKIAPLCGGGMNWRAWALNMPIRVYHGRRDDVVPLSQSEAMVNSVKIQGGNVEFTIYDDLSHNCWDRAFEKTDLIKWLVE